MINAFMATMPARADLRAQAASSLLPQVDGLHVRDGSGGLGDANKFWHVRRYEGYIFTVDDDIIYPPNYCEYLVDKIEGYDRKAVITLHGRNFKEFPITSYRGSFERIFCLKHNPSDTEVKIVGTGVTAWHHSTLDIGIDDFESKNMADIWFSRACQRQSVPRVCVAFEPYYLTGLKPDNPINAQYSKDDSRQVEAVNAIDWNL